MAKGTYQLTGGELEPRELNWGGNQSATVKDTAGRAENIPKTWSRKPAQAAAKQQHYAVITEGSPGRSLWTRRVQITRAEAAKLLGALTSAHRTSCYRALRLKGRFARHLHSDGTTLSWRPL